jgi:hypothetical protein
MWPWLAVLYLHLILAERVSFRGTGKPLRFRLEAPVKYRGFPFGVRVAWRPLQGLRQIRTDRAARIAVTARLFLHAVGGGVVGEGEQLYVATIPSDQIGEAVAARAPAFRALDSEHVELADQAEKTVAPSLGILIFPSLF